MNIGIAYADKFKQVWLKLDIPEGSTVQQAIEKSGLLEQFPEINLKRQKVGIFGKIIRLDTPLVDGNRVEIYRPIIADPETVERRDNR
jgi:putative ubiquitin-RnfH superfamily antitoxin RatB of RatAB toxin-antitoxin module